VKLSAISAVSTAPDTRGASTILSVDLRQSRGPFVSGRIGDPLSPVLSRDAHRLYGSLSGPAAGPRTIVVGAAADRVTCAGDGTGGCPGAEAEACSARPGDGVA